MLEFADPQREKAMERPLREMDTKELD